MSEQYTVGRVAQLAGVSVRTLHHYDAVALVRPSGRAVNGYRVYAPADIQRLHQVLVYRRLGFGLAEIAVLLDDPAVDPAEHLRRQRALLVQRGEQVTAMLAAIDRLLEATGMGIQLTPEEQFEVFGTDKVGGEWAEEAEQRWGDTAAYQQAQRRTASYAKQDWQRLKAEADAGLQEFASAMRDGAPADGERARTLAEAHRAFLTRWFYDCSHDMHRGLAATYVDDDRFRATFEAVAPGLAQYVSEAIVANADAATSSPGA